MVAFPLLDGLQYQIYSILGGIFSIRSYQLIPSSIFPSTSLFHWIIINDCLLFNHKLTPDCSIFKYKHDCKYFIIIMMKCEYHILTLLEQISPIGFLTTWWRFRQISFYSHFLATDCSRLNVPFHFLYISHTSSYISINLINYRRANIFKTLQLHKNKSRSQRPYRKSYWKLLSRMVLCSEKIQWVDFFLSNWTSQSWRWKISPVGILQQRKPSN